MGNPFKKKTKTQRAMKAIGSFGAGLATGMVVVADAVIESERLERERQARLSSYRNPVLARPLFIAPPTPVVRTVVVERVVERAAVPVDPVDQLRHMLAIEVYEYKKLRLVRDFVRTAPRTLYITERDIQLVSMSFSHSWDREIVVKQLGIFS